MGLKQISILFVLFFHEVKIIHGYERLQNIVTEWVTTFNSFGEETILVSNNKFLRIVNYEPEYKSGNYFLHINSLDPRESHSTCKIPVTSHADVFVVGLGKGNVVARLAHSIYYEIVIINPIICTNITIFYDKRSYAVFPYHDTFDIVDDGEQCPSGNGCVYRYNDAGNLIQKFDKIETSSYYVSRRFGMFKEYTPSENYFIIRRIKDSLTAIDVLNSTFMRVNSYAFDHSIKAYSTAHGHFGLCYTMYDRDGPYDGILQCKILDWKFNTLVNATEIKYDKTIRSMKMHNLPDGGAIVVYCIPKYVWTCHVYYRHIDASGNAGEEDTLIEQFGSEDVNIYIFEADAVTKTYCIVLSARSTVHGKCIIV